jgi:tetratricopeptide (TPR) repeat protein
MSDRNHWLKSVVLPEFILIFVTFLVFLPSLNNGWVNWDDPSYVLNNPLVTADTLQWSKIWKTEQILGIYHPVTLLSYAFDHSLWGTRAFGYHLTNVLLHIANTVLVFLTFRRLNQTVLVAFVVALLFGIHPMHVESVSWISERKDVLYLFFFLLAWLSYFQIQKHQSVTKWFWYAGMVVLFSLSILSKPIAFVFPAVLILTDYLRTGHFTAKQITHKTPLLLLSLIAMYLAQWGQAESDSISTTASHPVPTLFYGTYNYILYAVKALVPFKLAAFHPFPLAGSAIWIFYSSILPFVGVLGLLFWSFKHSKPVFFGLLFFSITILPLLQVIPFGKTLTSERYTYLPYLGLFYLLALGLQYVIQRYPNRKFLVGAGVLGTALIFIVLNVQQQKIWRNSETLWSHAITSYPDSYYPYLARGRYYKSEKKITLAEADFRKSIENTPNAEALYEVGLLHEERGRIDSALSYYLRSIQSIQGYSKSHHNAGLIYGRKGDKEKAHYHLNEAIALNPSYDLAHFNLGVLCKMENDYQKALKHMQAALDIQPSNLKYLEFRAAIYTNMGKTPLAIRDFERVLTQQPKNARAHFYLAMNYHKSGNTAEAANHFARAKQLNYSLPEKIQRLYNL